MNAYAERKTYFSQFQLQLAPLFLSENYLKIYPAQEDIYYLIVS